MILTQAAIREAGAMLDLTWANGAKARFDAIWLRDNALDSETRATGNGQRLITILDVPQDVRLAAAAISPSGDLNLTFAPEGKSVGYPASWLAGRIYDRPAPSGTGWTDDTIQRWDSGLQDRVPRADLAEITVDRTALRAWLAAVRRYGFAVLSGVPATSGAVCDVASTFAYVRETNYGRWFDVRAEVEPSNLAYTNLGLQAHTDNPYRDPVPTLQLLACLENSVEGGDSLVVDGFKAVERLQAQAPGHFDLLTRYCARFDYAGTAGVRLRAKRPFIELGPDGELLAVRFNNRSAAPFVDVPQPQMRPFYDAYRGFAELIEDPALAVTFRLAPGELFIVDNTRVLHARKAFSSSGARWLQGCYADKDGLLSTLAALEGDAGGVAS